MHAELSPLLAKLTFRTGAGLALLALLLAVGCTKEVRYTIGSEPAGAFTTLQIQPDDGPPTEWIFLGTTPVVTTRDMDKSMVADARSFTIKVVKDGYLEQTKVWSGNQMLDELDAKGGVFWSPRLVPSIGAPAK